MEYMISIDGTAVEDEVADNMYQRLEWDWTIYSKQLERNRQRNRRIDLHEIIVLERSGTFQHYFVQGGFQ